MSITVKAETARPFAVKWGEIGWLLQKQCFQPSKTERSQPQAMTEFRGHSTSQCHSIILKPKSLILLLSEPPHMGTSSKSWLKHRNLMFRKSLSCPYKQFHHNNLASGTRGSFKFCSAWFTIKI